MARNLNSKTPGRTTAPSTDYSHGAFKDESAPDAEDETPLVRPLRGVAVGALGAQRGDIAKMVIRYGMKPIVCGILLGVAGSLAASRVLRSLLFEVQQTDVPTYVVVTLLLAMVGLTAAYLPSRRAATIDPLEALRE